MSSNATPAPVELPAPSEQTDDIPTVVLFSIGGQEYRIPEKPKVNIALKYLVAVERDGEDAAAAMLLRNLLGDEGFEGLADYDDLTADQFEAVMKAAQKHALGALENKRPNSGRGPRR